MTALEQLKSELEGILPMVDAAKRKRAALLPALHEAEDQLELVESRAYVLRRAIEILEGGAR